MITNTGKNIIAKYLLGQAPAFASYIAVGCGPKPLSAIEEYGDYSEKKSLDFEMFRVPISSRGFVNEDGVSKLVLTAELPTEERYEISEIGIYSAGINSAAGSYDSKTILAFSETENWQHHTSTTTTSIGLPIVEALDAPLNNNIIATTSPVFQTNADNSIFYKESRANIYERSRFLNNMVMISGNDANLTKDVSITTASGNGTRIEYTTSKSHNLKIGDTVTVTGVNPVNYNITGAVSSIPSLTKFTLLSDQIGTYISGGSTTVTHFYIESGSNHIHLTGTQVDFSKNSPGDELKLAFSVINKDGTSSSSPDKVRVLVEFSSSDTTDSGEHARFEADMINGTGEGEYDLDSNRYHVITKQLQQLYTTPGFNWNAVSIVKVYVTTLVADVISEDYYVALDAMRLENVSTVNALYGLTGYSVIKNTDQITIVKSPNTANYVEFRFAIGVS
jgi:hypothetical protein